MLNKHPLYILADQINRQLFEESFKKHCREGRRGNQKDDEYLETESFDFFLLSH